MRKFAILIPLGLVALLGGVVSLVVLVQRLTERGLDADANGTVGFTTSGEVVQGLVGVALILGGPVLALFGLVRSRAT